MKPSIGLNLRVTGHCNQGGRKYMEDAFVVAYQQSEDQKDLEYAYFGIFDGHGGREAALFAKEHLMNNIVCQKAFWSDDDSQVLKAIRDGFLATHRAMWKEVGKWPKTVSGLPSTSGTTSSIAFIRRRKLYIGHVGDSKIVLGFQLPDSEEWCAQALTKDHKPESPEEKRRINSVGGLVMNKAGVERVVWNRPHPGHKGPIRRSTPFDQIPFLAVARSLGDLWSYNYLQHEFVVSPDPDVDVININPHVHRCVIFASDGLWNMLSTQTAVKMVQTAEEENENIILEGGKINGAGKLNNPSRLLVDFALKRWFDLGMRADNTSVVTVMLDPPGPPKSEVLLKQRVMKRLRPRDEQTEDGDDTAATVESPCPANVKDKKRTIECTESCTVKDRKLSEPPCKERKLSTDIVDTIPKNLPKPVILSPHRVVKQTLPSDSPPPPMPQQASNIENHDAAVEKIRSSDVNPTSAITLDAKVKKKGHDPPDIEVATTNHSEAENKVITPTSTQFEPKSFVKSGESSKNVCLENSRDKQTSLSSIKNDLLKTEKNDSSLQTNTNSKENGRIHLCEVDNFFKLNNRTSDCNESRNSAKSSDLQKNDSIVSPKIKNFRKSTLSRRNNAQKSLNTLKKPRLHQTNISTCRTRAQSNIQKLKL